MECKTKYADKWHKLCTLTFTSPIDALNSLKNMEPVEYIEEYRIVSEPVSVKNLNLQMMDTYIEQHAMKGKKE